MEEKKGNGHFAAVGYRLSAIGYRLSAVSGALGCIPEG
jgi:hypothetical protein